MTIRRGVDWGRPGQLPPGAPVADSDAELRALLEAARRAGGERPPPLEVDLRGGDLLRTLGGVPGPTRPAGGRAPTPASAAATAAAGRASGGQRLEVDAVRATLDGRDHWFTAHLVARRRLWRGRFVVAMNAQWLDGWRAGPRAHPADGLVDVTEGALPFRQRWAARRRAPTGDHLPHPALRAIRVSSWSTAFERPTPVWLDGVRVGRCRSLELLVEPDALAVVV